MTINLFNVSLKFSLCMYYISESRWKTGDDFHDSKLRVFLKTGTTGNWSVQTVLKTPSTVNLSV